MSGKKENVQSSGITRRDFVKGLAIGAAGLGIATILPGGIITAASAADTTTKQQVGKQGDGIYIDGVAENMKSKTYTLEFVQPIKLVAVKDGKVQSEGTWRTTNKHLVSVDPDGTTIMRDGVGGYDVEISWTLGSTTYAVTLHTGQTAGAHAIEVDHPMTRGDFMIRLAKYFGWPHYNAVMDDGTDINDKGEVMTTERVRNFYDVTGDNDYVKAIESALDMGVLTATSPEDCFYPMSEMTREDAAVILVSAFKMSKLSADYISKFDDTNKIDKNCYDALNILVGRNFMRGRSNTTLNPTDGITDTEARIIIESIDRRVVCPVWAMPVSNRKFVRVRPEWFTSTQDAVVHWRCKVDKYSHPELNGLFVQDRGDGTLMAQDGNEYETLNWTGLTQSGKHIHAQYKGVYDGKTYYRLEIDRTGENAQPEDGLYFDYKTNAHLSNIYFKDATLVGHDFKYKTGFDAVDDKLEDGRLKYAIPNKFVPYEYDYEVKVGALQSTVTFTPVAMSNRIKDLKVNGKSVSSRCPVSVPASGKTTIEVTGPDGSTKATYTLTFVVG